MKAIPLLLLPLFPFSVTAQSNTHNSSVELVGSGRIVREAPTVARFDAIDISQFPAQIRVNVCETKTSVAVSVDDNLRSLLQVKSENGTLKLSFIDPQNRPFWIRKANVTVQISTPALNRLKHGSNGDVSVTGINEPSFNLINEANGNVTLRGKATTFTVTSLANGTIDATGLAVQTATVVAAANATIRVNAQSVKTTKQAFASVINAASQTGNTSTGQSLSTGPVQPLITIRFENNSALPHTVTLISYRPGTNGNETNSFTVAPYANRQKQYAIGTAVYLATKNQIDLVMSGERLRGKPLLTVAAQDEGRTIKLNN